MAITSAQVTLILGLLQIAEGVAFRIGSSWVKVHELSTAERTELLAAIKGSGSDTWPKLDFLSTNED